MKQLALLLVLIVVLGLGGFVYRYTMEQPDQTDVTACTMEARICPDGSSVGRSGPDCSFAPCAFPNVEIPEAGVSFAVPSGYTQLLSGAPDQETLRIFEKPSLSENAPHTIHVKRYPIPAGQTAEQVILANTRYQPVDMQAEDLTRFTTVNAGGKSYRSTVIERFEALVQSSYFLVRENDVLRFDIVEHDVTEWMNPDLVVADLPEHSALLRMLGTFQGN
ncbi:MAG: hypothetical protein QOE22_486 [Candidatus Parcubacteria bacterium]|jgi:hypothetical protein|nr:hypothetical protein [Candidatus Parcubacteria bacterium]